MILRDSNFSSLLQKIKNAYTDYVTKLQGSFKDTEQIDLDAERQKNLHLQE